MKFNFTMRRKFLEREMAGNSMQFLSLTAVIKSTQETSFGMFIIPKDAIKSAIKRTAICLFSIFSSLFLASSSFVALNLISTLKN